MFGSGSMANVPKRPAGSDSSFLEYSFDSRQTRTAVSLPSGVTCGVGGDRIAVATPPLSMSSTIFCGDQFDSGKSLRPITSMAFSQDGGTTWACTSMRCGFACANTFGAKPVAASPAAAAPATNCRRLMPLAPSGSTQQAQSDDSARPFHFSMLSSLAFCLCLEPRDQPCRIAVLDRGQVGG